MSNVPKGKQKESRFEADHHYYNLRDSVNALMQNNFGFDATRYQKRIDRFRETHSTLDNIDEIVKRYEDRSRAYVEWFLPEEREVVRNMLVQIQTEFTLGNSIHPAKDMPEIGIEECVERRLHIDRAIGWCYSLKQELQAVIRELPVDINKYVRFSKEIDDQIALYRGVKKNDNKLTRQILGQALNVANSTNFANVNANGNANANNASNSNGVRPDFRGSKNKTAGAARTSVKGKPVPPEETSGKCKPGDGRELATAPDVTRPDTSESLNDV